MEGKMKMDEDGTTHSLPFTLPSAKSVKLYPAPSLNLFNNVGSKVASSTETSKVLSYRDLLSSMRKWWMSRVPNRLFVGLGLGEGGR